MVLPIIGQHEGHGEKNPECPLCTKEMELIFGKKGVVFACRRCQVAIGVTDPLVLKQNLIKQSTMMKKGDPVIIGQIEWEVVIGKGEWDFLLRRPNPKDKKKMDFCIVEVIDFIFDKEQRKWIEVEALPEDSEELFKK